jgi:hypothetical protein
MGVALLLLTAFPSLRWAHLLPEASQSSAMAPYSTGSSLMAPYLTTRVLPFKGKQLDYSFVAVHKLAHLRQLATFWRDN